MPASSPMVNSARMLLSCSTNEGVNTSQSCCSYFNAKTGGKTMVALTINGQSHSVDVEPDTPLLWVLRDNLGMTGTKFGCGIAQCGACTVHVDGVAMRSCSVPVSAVAGKQVATIESLAVGGKLSAVQQAWLD